MDQLVGLILIALAVYRLSYLISREDGPADAAKWLRQWADDALPGTPLGDGVTRSHWLARGLYCPLCISFWLSLAAWPLGGPLAWLACAGMVLVIHKAVD